MEPTPDQQRRNWSIRLVFSPERSNQSLKRKVLEGKITPVDQTRLGSLGEVAANAVVGFGLLVGANLLVLPEFGYSPSLQEAIEIGVIFTGIGLTRSYALRRLFNRRAYALTHRKRT